MEFITIEEAKTVIDNLSAKDQSNQSTTNKRAKILNLILNNYHLIGNEGSYNSKDKFYSLAEIAYLLGTSRQYIKSVEKKAVAKIIAGMDADMALDFNAIFATEWASETED